MPRKNARVGDKVVSTSPQCQGGGRCCPHPWQGFIQTGAQTINNLPAARLTDIGPTCCPHGGIFEIVTSSAKVMIDNQLVARVGDFVRCKNCQSMGVIIAPTSPNVSTLL